MANKFEVGNRVKFYGTNDEIEPDIGCGTVVDIFDDGLISIQRDDNVYKNVFHPRQLRRLKKKTAPTFWVNEEALRDGCDFILHGTKRDNQYVQVKLIRVKYGK